MPPPSFFDGRAVLIAYQGGIGLNVLSRRFHVHRRRLRAFLEVAGVLRNQTQAMLCVHERKHSLRLADMTPAALRALYWHPSKPSLIELGDRLGYCATTISRYLDKHGIRRRTASEQQKADLVRGRRSLPPGMTRERAAEHMRSITRGYHPGLMSAVARQKSAATRRHRLSLICFWCGTSFERWPCQMKGQQRVFCSRSCQHQGQTYPEGFPRPLIVAQLREGKTPSAIGALEPDLRKWQTLFPDRSLLSEAAPRTPSMLHKPHNQTPLTEEDLGPLGQALLDAARKQNA